jgi:arylamine N-acetyltransferase
MLSDNDLDSYLEFIEVKKESLSLDEESLKNLTFGHVSHIAYQNQTIYNRLPLNLDSNALIQKLVKNKEGGMCYETADLFYDVLLKLGFSAKRIKAYPLNGKPYNPKAPSSHNIIIVELNSKLFLVDVGYGNNSMRYPVDFDFEKTNIKEVFPGENYKFEVNDNYFQLNIKIKDKYESMYRFDRPFDEINIEGTLENMKKILEFEGMMPIRDLYLKSSILTKEGKIGFYAEPRNGIKTAYMFTETFGERKKEFFQTWDEFAKRLNDTLKVNMAKTIKDNSK